MPSWKQIGKYPQQRCGSHWLNISSTEKRPRQCRRKHRKRVKKGYTPYVIKKRGQCIFSKNQYENSFRFTFVLFACSPPDGCGKAFRLVLESAPVGTRMHDVDERLGWLAPFTPFDNQVSSKMTQKILNWKPERAALRTNIERE